MELWCLLSSITPPATITSKSQHHSNPQSANHELPSFSSFNLIHSPYTSRTNNPQYAIASSQSHTFSLRFEQIHRSSTRLQTKSPSRFTHTPKLDCSSLSEIPKS